MNWRLPSRARRVVAKKAIRTAVAAKRIEEIAHPVDEVVVAVVADVDAANNAISSALRRAPTSLRGQDGHWKGLNLARVAGPSLQRNTRSQVESSPRRLYLFLNGPC